MEQKKSLKIYKRFTNNEGTLCIMTSVQPDYIAVAPGSIEGGWHAMIGIEFPEHLQATLLKHFFEKMKEQKIPPGEIKINLPGEVSMIHQALLTRDDFRVLFPHEKIIEQETFILMFVMGAYCRDIERSNQFMELMRQDKAFYVAILERPAEAKKDTSVKNTLHYGEGANTPWAIRLELPGL